MVPSTSTTTTGPKGEGTEISCFHANTRVRMFTTMKGSPEYKRMDNLVKGDKLWTRRYRSNWSQARVTSALWNAS